MTWEVQSINDGRGSLLHGPGGPGSNRSNSWYIVDTETGRSKRVGPVTLRGTNYYDRAVALAAERNKKLPRWERIVVDTGAFRHTAFVCRDDHSRCYVGCHLSIADRDSFTAHNAGGEVSRCLLGTDFSRIENITSDNTNIDEILRDKQTLLVPTDNPLYPQRTKRCRRAERRSATTRKARS